MASFVYVLITKAVKNNLTELIIFTGPPSDSEHRGGEDTRKTAGFLHFIDIIIIPLTC